MRTKLKAAAKGLYLSVMPRIDRWWIPLQNNLWDFSAKTWPSAFQGRINSALDRGIAYFAAIDEWEIDSLFALRDFVDSSFDERLIMTDAALQRHLQQWRNPFLRLFWRDYDVESSNPSAPNVYEPPRDMHQLMMDCVNADRLALDKSFLPKLLAMEDGGGYGTTHILLGCVFLKRYSSIDHQRLDQLIAATIPTIVSAQNSSRVSDIYSERVAMLQWLGLQHLIRPAWITRIVKGQLHDGGWYWERPPFSTSSYQHPTCLAVAAMLQYRKIHFQSA